MSRYPWNGAKNLFVPLTKEAIAAGVREPDPADFPEGFPLIKKLGILAIAIAVLAFLWLEGRKP